MKYRSLGTTDIRVSEIAMGCWGLSGDSMWGHQAEADSLSTVAAALDAGVNFFDTAEAYGDGVSEQVLGKALAGRRGQAIVATKIRSRDLSAPAVQQACERSLKRLNTDYIDLYQTHWPDRNTPIEETMEALTRLREAGKIRAIGMSNFGVGDLAGLLQFGTVAANQLPYSLLWRAIEYQIQELCIQENIGILCYSPLMHGLLAGKYVSPEDVPVERARTRHFSQERSLTRHGEAGCEAETFAAIDRIRQIAGRVGQPIPLLAVSWLLHRPGVTSVIVGARRASHITQMAHVPEIQLEDSTIKELSTVTENLKIALDANPDMWQSPSRYR